jgi:4-amino-4-deoxy-L-arabinose transferase-like glycosyltransferase
MPINGSKQAMTADPTGSASRSWTLLIVLALFLGVSTLYNVTTPIYEAPDELQHMAFVVWLADGQGLPMVDTDDLGPWGQEGAQPPLYYWIMTTLVGKLPHYDAGNLAEINPYAGIGDPQRPDNKNRVLHDIHQESWPYPDRVLFPHVVRAISTLMAVGTLLGLYRLGRMVFPNRPGVALGMVGLVAFMPQFLFLSASVNNDNLVILISTWVLVFLTSWLRASGLPRWPSLVGLGVLLGLGALAKYGGLLLWLLVALVMAWLAWRQKGIRWLLIAGLIVFGLALALSGWWFVGNLLLYGDLSGLNVHLEIVGTRRRLPTGLAAIREFRGFRYSFWGLFGWFNILAPDPFYWIMDALTALGLVGLVVFGVRSFRRLPGWTQQALVMLVVWLGLVVIGVLRWTTMTPASQGRLLYPALGGVALFLVVGWAELLPSRLRRPAGVAAVVIWLVWAVLCPFLVIKPAYALPERVNSLDEVAFAPSELHVRFGGCCELVGYVSPNQPVQPGDVVPLTFVWRVTDALDQNYTLFVHATTVDGQIMGQLDTFHGGGMYPTGQWRRGEIIVDTVFVPISWEAAGPALLRFNAGLSETPSLKRLAMFAADGHQIDVVLVGEAALVPSQWPEPQTDPQTDAVFGEQIQLTGVELPEAAVHAGEVVTVTLQWTSLATITEDYTGFVHLANAAGTDVAQDDHPPMAGYYPTRLWSPGTVISDAYRLELPDDLKEGTHKLWAGLYYSESGLRLEALAQETGRRWKDDLVYIGTLEITVDQE